MRPVVGEAARSVIVAGVIAGSIQVFGGSRRSGSSAECVDQPSGVDVAGFE
jgi:hypothetical protein